MSTTTISQILQTINSPTAKPNWILSATAEPRTKYEVDPLACSVAFHRTNQGYGLGQNSNNLTEADIETAKEIRTYYSKKYFWTSLKSKDPQSDFRTNTMRLLAIESDWDLTDREAGVFVKLPCFYKEDTFYDELKTKLKTDKDLYFKKGSTHTVTKKLTYQGKTFRWQNIKRVSWWFADEDGKLYSFTTSNDHPFNQLFEEKIQDPFTLEFSYGIDNISDMWYNSIKSFNFVKEQHA